MVKMSVKLNLKTKMGEAIKNRVEYGDSVKIQTIHGRKHFVSGEFVGFTEHPDKEDNDEMDFIAVKNQEGSVMVIGIDEIIAMVDVETGILLNNWVNVKDYVMFANVMNAVIGFALASAVMLAVHFLL